MHSDSSAGSVSEAVFECSAVPSQLTNANLNTVRMYSLGIILVEKRENFSLINNIFVQGFS